MRLRNPFRSQIIGLALCAGLAIAGALPLLLLGIHPAVTRGVAIMVLALGAVALITLLVLVFLGRSYIPAIASILGGAHWAHWRYDMGEWERFIEQERRRNRTMLSRAAAILVVAILVVAVFSGTSDMGLDIPDLLYLLVLGAALLLALIYNAGSWSLYAWRRDPAREAYISPLGVYRPDGYHPLRGVTRKLLRVAVVQGDPAVLVFYCHVVTLTGATLVAVPIQIRVPIPFGREDEARVIARRFGSVLAAR